MSKKVKKIISDPNWGFDFKISIDKHIVNLEQGKQISIKVRLESARGTSQDVPLRVNMQWESVGLTTKISPSSLNPMEQWEATMMIRASATTPPGSYLYTVEGSTNGTFKVSEDAVMVNVYPKDKKIGDNQNEPEDQNDFQTGQPNTPASESFDLDKLFTSEQKVASPSETAPKAGSGMGFGIVIAAFFITFGIIMIVVAATGGFNNQTTDVKVKTGSNCPTSCGSAGVGVGVPQSCPCPRACPYTYIANTGNGYKECANVRPH